MALRTEEAMKKSRFSEEQMVKILREADKVPVAQVAKKHGVSEQTIYTWRKRFGALEVVDVKRLRQVEQENAKLKKLVAERDLEIDVMKEVAQKNDGERVRSTQAGRVRTSARDLASQGVRAASGGQVDDRVRVEAREAGRAGDRRHARAGCPVPEVRVSPHPGLPGASWLRDERGSRLPALEAGRATSAEAAAQEAGCNKPTPIASR